MLLAKAQNKTLTLRVMEKGKKKMQIEVIDNGIGISPDNLTKIFSYGFTTKKDGHGFGLHLCALMAKEMGGSLKGDSAGLEKGAIFTLVLPCKMENGK